jgi:hypothetical protein
MKRIFAILILPFMLASGIQVSIDHHYCGGILAATNISVTGKLASCGMAEKEQNCSGHASFDKKCCEDKLSYYGINCKFVPENYKLSIPFPGKDIPAAPAISAALNYTHELKISSWVLPPGDNLNTGILLSKICVSRI